MDEGDGDEPDAKPDDKPVMWMTVDGLTFPIGEIE